MSQNAYGRFHYKVNSTNTWCPRVGRVLYVNAHCTVEAVPSTPEVSTAFSSRCTERRAWRPSDVVMRAPADNWHQVGLLLRVALTSRLLRPLIQISYMQQAPIGAQPLCPQHCWVLLQPSQPGFVRSEEDCALPLIV